MMPKKGKGKSLFDPQPQVTIRDVKWIKSYGSYFVLLDTNEGPQILQFAGDADESISQGRERVLGWLHDGLKKHEYDWGSGPADKRMIERMKGN